MPITSQKPAYEGLFELEHKLIALAADFKLNLHRSPPVIRTHLANLSAPALADVFAGMNTLIQNFQTCMEEDIDPWDDVEFFKLSMRSQGLSYPGDFLDNVARGDLIEGYDMKRLQVFRNMRFMELSSYSLMEILSYEWPLLFDRANAITTEMISYCDEILWTANRTIPFDIPLHFIRELRSEERQLLEVRFKYLSPVFSGPNQPFGLLGTCSVKQVNAEAHRDNLDFV
ncbi:MAG: hypothetical protein ACXVA9_05720 [Bdellovibrionales bacterium]